MFVLVKFINPLVNKIYSLTLKKSDLNLPLKNYLKEEDEIIFEKFSIAYKILTNKEFNKDCKLNFFIIDKTENNNNNDENIINNIYKIYAENYNKKAFTKLQIIRFLDDWAYQANVRQQIKSPSITAEMTYFENKLKSAFNMDFETKYSFPWSRLFEIEVNLELN